MKKVTLTHIGIFSLGRLMAVWAFILGLISLILSLGAMVVMMILSGSSASDLVMSLGLSAVLGFVGLVVMTILAFILGALTALVYNVFLGVGGGLDLDFKERD